MCVFCSCVACRRVSCCCCCCCCILNIFPSSLRLLPLFGSNDLNKTNTGDGDGRRSRAYWWLLFVCTYVLQGILSWNVQITLLCSMSIFPYAAFQTEFRSFPTTLFSSSVGSHCVCAECVHRKFFSLRPSLVVCVCVSLHLFVVNFLYVVFSLSCYFYDNHWNLNGHIKFVCVCALYVLTAVCRLFSRFTFTLYSRQLVSVRFVFVFFFFFFFINIQRDV